MWLMNQQSATAVADAPESVETVRPEPGRPKPKRLPPYAVVVLNDDLHTFEYVMETFKKVFGYDTPKCFLLAKTIHEQGRAVVWSGSKEVAELKRDQIRSAGPDFYASKKVEFPLGVLLEPLPG
jgi:ATP-dependent Clp protease adaptor protein ClpS